MEVRDITKLEQLSELGDGSYIVVVEDGVAKLISKENANFGGGKRTVFYAGVKTVSGTNVAMLSDETGTEITIDAFVTAFRAGEVLVYKSSQKTRVADTSPISNLPKGYSSVIAATFVDSDPNSVSFESNNIVAAAVLLPGEVTILIGALPGGK